MGAVYKGTSSNMNCVRTHGRTYRVIYKAKESLGVWMGLCL